MKDYYRILDVPENTSREDIKSAFRRLAFKYHPDTSSENKKQAEEKFKEINEAYGVLGDESKRRQYDSARKGQFVGYDAGYGGFQYSQQDIFRDIFSNQATFDEMSRMFSQAGLRFDQDFFSRVFFGGSGVVYQFSFGPGGINRQAYKFGDNIDAQPYQQNGVAAYKPNWIERLISGMTRKVGAFTLRHVFGLQLEPLPQELDQHIDLEISPEEAKAGGEKKISYKRGKKTTRLMVRIPAGIKSGTQIRLKNMGMSKDKKEVDLYINVTVKG